ncbi:MAG TPA: thiamine-phosphate kinase [Verrucomicrobiae bacterium]|nr:thiamine-phosphate kinase [Verrucomicrobiae bacterium]
MVRAAGDADDLSQVRWSAISPTVATTGEEALLAQLHGLAGGAGPDLVIPPGDDAAGWLAPEGSMVLVTTDALVEDIDFRRSTQLPYEVGWKAYAVNASDLAAMGAWPQLVVVTLLLPADTPTVCVLALQQGIRDAADQHHAQVVGGDLSGTPAGLAVSCTALGTARPDRCLRRSCGRPGDHILVTGELGGAAAALERLEAGDSPERVPWSHRLLRPEARVRAGVALATAGVRCAIDCSDGMLLDTARLAAASGCGAELWADATPLAIGLEAIWGAEATQRALAGGEDFELIAAAPAEVAQGLIAGAGWPSDLPSLRLVGHLRRDPGVILRTRRGGPILPFAGRGGFTHF